MIIVRWLCFLEMVILLILWFWNYYPDQTWNVVKECDWYLKVLCALICYYTLGKSPSLTQTDGDGCIIKQIFIGY